MPRTQTLEQLARRPVLPDSPEIQALARHVLAVSRDRIAAAMKDEAGSTRSRLGAAARRVASTHALQAGVATLTRPRVMEAHRASRVATVLQARPVARFRPRPDALGAELAEMSRAQGWTVDPDVLARPADDPDLVAGLKFRKLRMFVTEVRCREETDEIGPDHVLIGGTRTNYLGETRTVEQWTVSTAMSSGGRRVFGMTRPFAGWNIGTDRDWLPCVYTAVVVLGEHDDGGFSDLVREIWNLVDSQVKAAVGGLVGAAVGSALGPLGAALGALVGALVGFLADWLLSLLGDNEDDLIDVDVLTMTLADVRRSYYDWARLTSPQGWTHTLFMRGDGGRYEVDVAFKVFPD